jgi:putative transposase
MGEATEALGVSIATLRRWVANGKLAADHTAGTARFAYNWALAKWQQKYDACKADAALPKPSQMALRRQLNSIKAEQFPWMLEVTKNAPQMAIIQLGFAFKNLFAGRAKYPKFRKKGIHDRFSLTNDQFTVDGSRIRLPNLGWVRMRETLRFNGRKYRGTKGAQRVVGSIATVISQNQRFCKSEKGEDEVTQAAHPNQQ